MNILVAAAHGLYQDYTASFVHNQIKEYVQAGHRVRAVVPVAWGKKTPELSRISAPVVRIIRDGVEIFYVRCLSLSEWGQHTFNPPAAEKAVMLCMNTLLKDFRPDIIHAHGILFGGRIGVRFKERCKVPLVITTHGGDTDVSLTEGQKETALRICDCADRIVAVSPLYMEKTRQIGTKTPLLCILNGFNLSYAVKAEKKAYSLLQVSSFIKRKHTDLTIRAAAELKKTFPALTLTLIGCGVEQENLEKLVRELKAESYVNFTGFLSNADVMRKMAESEIFLLPSTEEGFGIVYTEAMASGCITVGTEGEGIDGVIRNGVNGFLVKPNDVQSIVETVSRCFKNPKEAKKAAENGQASAKGLSWERNAAEYLKLFEALRKNRFPA